MTPLEQQLLKALDKVRRQNYRRGVRLRNWAIRQKAWRRERRALQDEIVELRRRLPR